MALLDDYLNAVFATSPFKLKDSATVAYEIRRSNDDALTDILLEDTGAISLSSTVSAGGTLSAWVGANSAYIRTKYDQTGSGNDVVETVNANQPRLINGGVLDVKNTVAAPTYDGTNKMEKGSPISALDSGNSYSVFAVANADASITFGGLWTATSGDNRLAMFCSYSTIYNVFIQDGSGSDEYDLSQARVNTNQKLQTFITDGTLKSAFDNGVAGTSDSKPNRSYTNDNFRLGVQRASSNFLIGTIQEIVIFSDSKSAHDMGMIQNEIDSRYDIPNYVPYDPPTSTTTVEVTWIDSISAAATGNKIYRDDVEIADIAMGVQTYQDTTAETGTEYKYEVQAYSATDETTQEVLGVNVQYITTA